METTKFLSGIAHELKFWKGFVKTERFCNGWLPNIKTPELNQGVYEFIRDLANYPGYIDRGGLKVLDVGSGVVSILNGTIPKENITTADPLGELYELVFDYKSHLLKAPEPYPGEELPYNEEFDVVHMSNAIDHSQDPVLTLKKLYDSCKTGGYIIVQGFENEGSFEQWAGFHQWDISYDNGYMKIADKDGNLKIVGDYVSKTHFLGKVTSDKIWAIWIIKK